MKNVLLTSILSLFFACGKKDNTNTPTPTTEAFAFNSSEGLDAKAQKDGFRWIFKGVGDQSKGQEFCDKISLANGENELIAAPQLSAEEKKLIDKVANDANASELKDDSGQLLCKKEAIKVSAN